MGDRSGGATPPADPHGLHPVGPTRPGTHQDGTPLLPPETTGTDHTSRCVCDPHPPPPQDERFTVVRGTLSFPTKARLVVESVSVGGPSDCPTN